LVLKAEIFFRFTGCHSYKFRQLPTNSEKQIIVTKALKTFLSINKIDDFTSAEGHGWITKGSQPPKFDSKGKGNTHGKNAQQPQVFFPGPSRWNLDGE
jgi:hypothetical protein